MFADRREAGILLAEKVSGYRGTNTVVLALPRGGVVLGTEVARVLKLPLDIIAVRKIGHPNAPEFALGAVDEKGHTLFDGNEVDVDREWLAKEIERETAEAKRRSALYRGGRESVPLRGKTAIIIDDGIATGLTMRLAVRLAKAEQPRRVVVAVPVSSAEAAEEISRDADELITLEPPEEFLGAVGAHYARFDQVSDSEVISLMKRQ